MPTTSESRIVAAPVREVWASIPDLETANRWNGAWRRVEYLSSQREGVGAIFRAHTEGGQTFDFRVSEWAPQEYIAYEPMQEEPEEELYLFTLESQSFLLKPTDEGHTKVTLSTTASAHGVWEWLRARLSRSGHQKNIFRRTLDALQAPVEWLFLRILWPGHQRQGLGSALEALQALYEPEPDEDEQTHADL